MNIPISPSAAVAPPQGVQRGAEPRVLLHSVSWQGYVTIGEVLQDRPNLRLTYDRGSLEIMTTSSEHERIKRLLSRFVETLAEEFGLEIAPYGNMTFQTETLEQAIESDDCFWIAHERQVRTMESWDPSRLPPPDLALEIEISRSALNRMGLYAALGIPEVWRCDGEVLRVHLLQSDGNYQESETSPTFPGIAVAEIILYLQQPETMGFLALVRAFRDWTRQQRSST
jgi:Uma2 family endonuclease